MLQDKILYIPEDDTTEFSQNQETSQFDNIPDPSETATIQNIPELSEETTNHPKKITKTDDSNTTQIPVHNITQNLVNDQTPNDTIHKTNQDNTSSTLSTLNTLTTQEFQQQQTIQRNYDPPPPSQYSPHAIPHNSPQQGSSNTQITNTVQFQTTTPTTQPEIPILAYTLAQNTQTLNMQPALTTITLPSNPLPNYTTCRHLLRLFRLQTIPTNPLSYSLISTNLNNTQPTITNNNHLNTLNPFSTSQPSNTSRNLLRNTQFQIPKPVSTNIRTNPHINATLTQPITNPPNMSSNVSNIPTYNTSPPSIKPQPTISQPTYITFSTSISDPMKPFDGLDHNYTPEEYLQPTSDHEYKFRHARRMAF